MNILFLTIDQHRWDFVTGGAVAGLRTPGIDRLRAAGTTFPHAFSNCPICMPTRFTWAHGLYASQAASGLLANAHDWPLDLPSLPGVMRLRGYRTALVGKLHRHAGVYRRDLRTDREATRQWGFDDIFEVSGKSLALWFNCDWVEHLRSRGLWEPYVRDVSARGDEFGQALRGDPSCLPDEDQMDTVIASEAVRWLEDYADERPFFLHASLCGPHFPVDPPGRFRALFNAGDMPVPEGVRDAARVAAWQERRAGYSALVAHVDEQISRILDALDASGRAGETLIVFGSDHGEMIGHHDRPNKGTPYETSVRTPVTFVLPGHIAAGRRDDSLVEAVDLPLTMAEAAGHDAETMPFRSTPGRSLWRRLVRADGAPVREHVYSEAHTGERAWRMVRDRRHKLVVRANGADQLFDLESDPWETQNRIADGSLRGVRDDLMRRLLQTLALHAPAPDRMVCLPRDDWWRGGLRDGPGAT